MKNKSSAESSGVFDKFAESSGIFDKFAESSLDSAPRKSAHPRKSARRSLSLSLSLRAIFNCI